jgi:uncharacterized membrane protein
MNELALAAAIGALSGSRTMLGPAVVARQILPASANGLLSTMALGELVADKSARIGNRTDSLQLAGRVAMGAMAAAAQAGRRHKIQSALAGAAGALAAAYGCFHVRRFATMRLGVPNVVAGLLEDTVALCAAARMLRRGRTRNTVGDQGE